MAAAAVGELCLHDVEGAVCDLCGEICDPSTQELNNLDCTFKPCSDLGAKYCLYHQDCLEKFLRGQRLEKCAAGARAALLALRAPRAARLTPPARRSRKAGFKCPRGCGKATRYDRPCPGKVRRSPRGAGPWRPSLAPSWARRRMLTPRPRGADRQRRIQSMYATKEPRNGRRRAAWRSRPAPASPRAAARLIAARLRRLPRRHQSRGSSSRTRPRPKPPSSKTQRPRPPGGRRPIRPRPPNLRASARTHHLSCAVLSTRRCCLGYSALARHRRCADCTPERHHNKCTAEHLLGTRGCIGICALPDPVRALVPRSVPKASDLRVAAASIRAAAGFAQAGVPRAPAARPAPADAPSFSAWGARKAPLVSDPAPAAAWAGFAAPAAVSRLAPAAPAWGGAGAARAAAAGAAAAAVPVGAESLLEGDAGGALGKAARKNAKRAERKAAHRAQARRPAPALRAPDARGLRSCREPHAAPRGRLTSQAAAAWRPPRRRVACGLPCTCRPLCRRALHAGGRSTRPCARAG